VVDWQPHSDGFDVKINGCQSRGANALVASLPKEADDIRATLGDEVDMNCCLLVLLWRRLRGIP
jgi:hypothetical protein